MSATISQQEKQFIRQIFDEIRENLDPYFKDRNLVLSNAQVFTFLMFAPSVLAIAADGVVDEKEIAILERISRQVDVGTMVNLDLHEMLAYAPEPENAMINEEFNIIIGGELLYLSRHADTYRQALESAVKSILKFDPQPSNDNSMANSFVKLMDSIIENNVNVAKEEEMKKMKDLQKNLGLIS